MKVSFGTEESISERKEYTLPDIRGAPKPCRENAAPLNLEEKKSRFIQNSEQ